MFVWVKVPEPWASQMDTMQFATKLLEEADVAVSPGSGFGPAGEGYLRLALVENESRLRQAVRQIGRCLASESRPAGTVALRCPALTTRNSAGVPANVTCVAPSKWAPMTLTSVPVAPERGVP